MTEYYDIILGLIPVAVFGLGGGLQVMGISQSTAVTIGGVVAVGMVLHAMFVKAPVEEQIAEQPVQEHTTGAVQAAD